MNCCAFVVVDRLAKSFRAKPERCRPSASRRVSLGQQTSSSELTDEKSSTNFTDSETPASLESSVRMFSAATSDLSAPRYEKSKPWARIRQPPESCFE